MVVENVLIFTDTQISEPLPDKEYDFVIALNVARITDFKEPLLARPLIGWFSPKLTHAGQSAFAQSKIKNFFASNLWFLGARSFFGAGTKFLVLSKLTHVGASAFEQSEIEALFAPNLAKIEAQAFAKTPIKLVYSEKLQICGQGAFSDCVLVQMLNGFQQRQILSCSCKVCFRCQKQFEVLQQQQMTFQQFIAKAQWDLSGMKINLNLAQDLKSLRMISFQQTAKSVKLQQLNDLLKEAQNRSQSKPADFKKRESQEMSSIKLEFDLELKQKEHEINQLKQLLKLQNDQFVRQHKEWQMFDKLMIDEAQSLQGFEENEKKFNQTADGFLAMFAQMQLLKESKEIGNKVEECLQELEFTE